MLPNRDPHQDDERRAVTRRTLLRGLAASAAIGASATSVTATETTESDAFTRTQRVDIESFDGTTIAASLYEPTAEGPHPAILITHGWGADRNAAYVRRWAENYASNGYVVLTYDSRGFGESGGEVGVDGPKEVEDASTLVSWLAAHDAVQTVEGEPDNPRVGMDGLSYGGGIQLNVAAADDRLDAIVPRWAWHDLRYALEPNEVVKVGWAALLYAAGVGGSRGLTSGDGLPDEDDAEYGLPPKLHEINTKAAATNEIDESGEAYLGVRSPAVKLDQLDTPALFLQGWPDTLFVPNAALWTAQALESNDVPTRLVFFEGGHTATDAAGEDQQQRLDAMALSWLDAFLKAPAQADQTARAADAKLAPVTYYEVQTGEWREAEDVPKPDAETQTRRFRDTSDGDSTVVLNSVIPTATSHFVPENEDTAGTAVDFDFPIEQAQEIFGAPTARLTIEPLGPETRLFVRVKHVRDGEETLINNQVTPVRVEGLEPTEIDLELVAFQRTFEPGDTLRMTIATTDAGFFASRESAGARIHHTAERPSTVEFPTVYW
ncbi:MULTISPECIES: CocE/NonD family hydrolase [unclassified Haladaptatus]|uniref:CocE/NonD family hydrolase n=1 Tax=unclassified Haladaptatus TaxID=2622732 RepID=UPI0023E82627|nr:MULTISPECIES: CocE/NonD family hydrolase [unclassified Haladaptatus]